MNMEDPINQIEELLMDLSDDDPENDYWGQWHPQAESWIQQYNLVLYESNNPLDRLVSRLYLSEFAKEIIAMGGFRAFLEKRENDRLAIQKKEEDERTIAHWNAIDVKKAIKRSNHAWVIGWVALIVSIIGTIIGLIQLL
jgi:hypothetical protein